MKINHTLSFSKGILQYLFILIFLVSGFSAIAQNYQEEFGKNRVQHHDFTWFEYETDNFIVYWSGDARLVAHSVVQLAEWDYADLQEILEHRVGKKISIVVYEDLTDLKMSNIGNEEVFTNTGGQTKIIENKIFVHFDGNHNNLRKQIKEGITQVYINNMLFGSNFQEVVQNAVLLNLPKWFSEGLSSYTGEKWNTQLDNELRDVILSGKYTGFEQLAIENPKLAGHSMWYYLDSNFGQSTVSNLIYLTRINRSVESGFLYVLGNPYGRTLINWKDYFEQRYAEGDKSTVMPDDKRLIKIKNKRKLPISNAKLSPNGNQLIYSTNEQGKQKVYVQDIANGKRKLLFKSGFRNNIQTTDYNYPLIAWSPNSQSIGIVYEQRDVIKFLQIDINNKEKIEEQDFAPIYQRVYSLDFINNNELLISGATKGISDLFIYRIKQRSSNRITNDFYDDLDPVLVKLEGKNGVLFRSNRGDYLSTKQNGMDTILPLGNFDIYYYELESGKDIARITNTPYASEYAPMAIDSHHYSFITDANGISNRYTGELEEYIAYYEKVVSLKGGEELIMHPDSIPKIDAENIDSIFIRPIKKIKGKNHPASAYKRSILEAYSPSSSKLVVENFLYNGRHLLYLSEQDPSAKKGIFNSTYRQQLLKIEQQKKKDANNLEKQIEQEKDPKEKPATWEFENDFNTSESDESTNDLSQEEKNKDPDFVFITGFEDEISEKEDKKEKENVDPIDIDNYQFENDFNTDVPDAAVIVENEEGRVTLQSPTTNQTESITSRSDKRVHRFYTPNILPHRRRFKASNVTVQMDNSQLFGGNEPFSGLPYNHVEPSIFLKNVISDVFEDFEIEGGLRVPFSFDGLEYYVTVRDLRKRLDKSYSYYRRSNKETVGEGILLLPYTINLVSNLIQAEFKYPLDIYSSFKGTARFRNDQIGIKANDLFSLELQPIQKQRASVRLEYIFDNTLDIDINIKHGSRAKVYAEVLRGMEVDLFDDFKFDFGNGFSYLVGLDARHYQRLGKHAVLAARVTGATSLGKDKTLFFIGGADSDLVPSINTNIPLPEGQEAEEFAYQTQATAIRGFQTNIRNGNSFFIGNLELRLPVMKFLTKTPPRSGILRNLQLVGFFDVGTAWRGKSPFSNDNPLNSATIAPPPNVPQTIVVNVNYFRDPIVAGFGGGVRTKLFGYFLRVDYARGIETKQLQKGRWHISLGTDF